MDFETENRLAVLLLEEARRLRQEADKQGVHAYLQKPNVRHRPNSRFLAATVLGVQQANRVVEIDEMWRAREKELELESKMKGRSSSRMDSRYKKRNNDSRHQRLVSGIEEGKSYATSSLLEESNSSSYSGCEDGLRDDEVDAFLHSRVKRGRGAIGSRMDEPGPYLPAPSGEQDNTASPDVRLKEQRRRVQGPEKPPFLISKSSYEAPSTSKHRDREEKKNRSRNFDRYEEKKFKHHRQHESWSGE